MDGFLVLREVRDPGPFPDAAACPSAKNAWDASDAALPGAAADVPPELPDAVSGRWAGPEPDVPAQDAWATLPADEAAAPDTPGAAPFAA